MLELGKGGLTGSPPRARGAHYRPPRRGRADRITPYPERTSSTRGSPYPALDHPACAGALVKDVVAVADFGIIPACAGSTL
jgi:hypothetical protein